MIRSSARTWGLLALAVFLPAIGDADAQQDQRGATSYMKVDITEPFAAMMARMSAAKPGIEKEHSDLLNERYDLSDRPAQGVTMERGKAAAGRRSRQAAGRDDLGESGGDEPGRDPRAETSFPRGSTPCRIPTTSRAASSFRTS